MMFLVNFMNHSYQFRWRPKAPCPQCTEIYKQNQENMFRFLRELLVSSDISIVFEEGGTCLNITETLRSHGNQRTIAQEVLASILDRTIAHFFVDITREEAQKLIEQGIINDIVQLMNQKCELRDSFIANGSLRNLPKNGSSALLLCADGHFLGVKHHFKEAGIQVLSDSIARFGWYISNDQIDSMHLNNH